MSGGGSPSPGRRETAASKMRILHKGELTKKGGHRKNWLKRYFTLIGNHFGPVRLEK